MKRFFNIMGFVHLLLYFRILQMMQIVASNKNVNLMSTSAVAACMSPLLLRPLLAGECDLGDRHMDMAGDSSFQLLQAAAAANHAQAIIIILSIYSLKCSIVKGQLHFPSLLMRLKHFKKARDHYQLHLVLQNPSMITVLMVTLREIIKDWCLILTLLN